MIKIKMIKSIITIKRMINIIKKRIKISKIYKYKIIKNKNLKKNN